MAKAIHTMIRVLDTTRSIDFYRAAFGLEPVHALDYPDFCLTYLRNAEADFEVELTENKGRTEAYETIRKRLACDGVRRIALVAPVDDGAVTATAELPEPAARMERDGVVVLLWESR